MKISNFIHLSLATMFLATAGTAIAKQEELPQITEDGLHRVADSKMAIVYAEPGADLVQYKRIQLLDAYVAFKKNWARDQRSRSADKLSVTSRDVEKIKTNLAKEFQQVPGQAGHHQPGCQRSGHDARGQIDVIHQHRRRDDALHRNI